MLLNYALPEKDGTKISGRVWFDMGKDMQVFEEKNNNL